MWVAQIGQNKSIVYRMGIEAENIIWTDLKTIGSPKWDDLVAKILTGAGKPRPKIDNKPEKNVQR